MIKDRIIQVIELKKIGKENFYKKIGMTSANFRGKAKETPINSNAIENILSEIPDINPIWLLTGKPPMLLSEVKNEVPPTNNSEVEALLREKMEMLEKNNALLEENKALLQAENERLKAEIQALKSVQSKSANKSTQPSQSQPLIQPRR
ncbi:hypothetical protein AB4865_07805 [Capnocytophaga sp. ARDL2]|uniref:hypothetical protein n=1 Tax=Capnocytophaga sp. ARDL2 TaxID=3238809 RepID=UPI0035590F25